jgi:protein CWC15
MSGTGRPTYRPRKGTADPAASYIESRHIMVRDLPSHLVVKSREKKPIEIDELKKKLEELSVPQISLDDAEDFDDEDEVDSGEITDSDSEPGDALLRELARVKKEKAEGEARKLQEARTKVMNQLTTTSIVNPEYSMKLNWTEEAVFHGQAAPQKAEDERKHVNDPVRNPTHYRFLRKYLHT